MTAGTRLRGAVAALLTLLFAAVATAPHAAAATYWIGPWASCSDSGRDIYHTQVSWVLNSNHTYAYAHRIGFYVTLTNGQPNGPKAGYEELDEIDWTTGAHDWSHSWFTATYNGTVYAPTLTWMPVNHDLQSYVTLRRGSTGPICTSANRGP